MKIQFVCQCYYPDNFLINEITAELVKKGHDVSVLTGLPDYSNGYVPKNYHFFKNRNEIVNGVKITRVPIIARRKSKILRAINYLSFYINSSIYALFHNFDADVVFAYQLAPILMVNAGIIIKKKIHKPLFLYCLDPWPDQLKVWNVSSKDILFKIVHKYCKYAYNSADLIGASSKAFKDYLVQENGVDENKVIYLPQHAEDIIDKETIKTDNNCINFVYAGSIGIQQNLSCLLKAISNIKTNKEFHLNIYGNGSETESCKKLTNELGINKLVTFKGRVNKEELSYAYQKADAFVLTLASEEKIGFSANTIPARFQSYLTMGKPIIASISGETKKLIEENKCGLVANADDEYSFTQIISDFINNKDKYIEYGKNARRLYENNYRKEIVIKQIEDILNGLE